ncbi:MAG: molecular chaperone HtpG [Holophaga sp.]
MTTPAPETLSFKSELKQVLHLITHSLYSHKEIFLRELLSNASDAIDKVRFNSLENEALLENDRDWTIRLAVDREANTLTVSDNGIGMDHDTIIEHLGTIAKSGTRAFLERLKDADAGTRPELIGQFGVGFYSSFMVADRVTVISRAAGSTEAVRWESDGQGEFTVAPAQRNGRGTDVILHLKDEEKDFLETWRLRGLVKQFSDYIEHPIVMAVEKKIEDKTTLEDETLNSQKALWLRSKADITEEEHNAFYRQISADFEDPLKVIHVQAEGTPSFRALLYLPKRKAMNLQFGDAKAGPRLYINRVLIQDPCEALLPAWLRFVKGVVDCPDLPLNVSREMLQQNPLLERIQKHLVKQVLKALEELKTAERETYADFFKELGQILKEGLGRDWERREAIADLLLFEHLKGDASKGITLAEYVEAMPEDQHDIYHLAGEDRAALAHAPSLEAFKAKGWDVLLLTDPIDPFVIPGLPEYKGKALKAADRHAPELPEAEKAKAEAATGAFQPLLDLFKTKLTGLKDVRLSSRLKESAACLVAAEDAMDPHMEQLLARLGQGHAPSPRVLELNPEHPTVKALLARHQADPTDARLESYAHLLLDQALIAEGSRPEDPTAFLARINELVTKDLG